MTDLTLVAGVKTQLEHAAPAADLYLSHWFRLARALAEARGPWKILSAQYGLLDPSELVEPYGRARNRRGRGPVRELAAQFLDPLVSVTEPGQGLLLLSVGERYFDALCGPLSAVERRLEAPLHGLSLSQQVLWLEAKLAEEGIESPPHRERSDQEKAARRERRAARRSVAAPTPALTSATEQTEE